MLQVGSIAVDRFLGILKSNAGLASGLANLSLSANIELPVLNDRQVLAQNIAFELEEKTAGAQYPSYHVYCEKISNTLREKFRAFSGTARMVAEVRVSQDRLEQIETILGLYVDAAIAVLNVNRGDWGGGMFYSGGYEIVFQPVKRGGKNFLQTAKVTFEVNVSL